MKMQTAFRHIVATAIVACLTAVVPGLSAQADTFGFGFQLGNSATSNVTGTNYGGVRFTAIDSITIDTLSFGLNNGSGSVEFALQADDGFGNPSGVDLAAGTVASEAGFKSAAIAPTALVAGNVYHIVARPVSTGAAGLRVILGPTVADIHTRDGSSAPNAAQVFSNNAGSTWSQFSFDSRALIWGVSNSATQQAQGQPYTTAVTQNLGANIYRGQTFTQNTGQDIKVNSITVSIARNTGTETTAGDVLVRLLEADTLTEVFSDTLLTPGDIAVGESGFFTANIAEASRPTLVDGVDYVLAVTSRDSTVTRAYRISTSRTDPGAGDVIAENFQGDTGHHVIGVLNGSGDVTSAGNTDTATLKHDSYFVLDVTPVPEPGSLGLVVAGAALMLARRRETTFPQS